jgi:hypothetical protein
MRARIEFNPIYTTNLLQNSNLIDSLITVRDENGFITEYWYENQVINNDEDTFRHQTLELIKNHFIIVFDEDDQNVLIANDNNSIATYLIRSIEQQNQRLIASIIDFII